MTTTAEEERHRHSHSNPVSAAHAIADAALAEAQQQLLSRKNADQVKVAQLQEDASHHHTATITSSNNGKEKEGASTDHRMNEPQKPPAASEASAHDKTESDTTAHTTEGDTDLCRFGDTEDAAGTMMMDMQVDLFGSGKFGRSSSSFLTRQRGGNGDDDDDDDDAECLDQLQQKLQEVWRFALENDGDENANQHGRPYSEDADKLFQRAYTTTLSLVGGMVDAIIQDGLHAYQQLDQKDGALALIQETVEAKDKELERLRDTDGNHRKTIQNLLRALEKTKTDTKDASQEALVETQLRSEVSVMTTRTEAALATASDAQRKCKLLDDELRQTKAKMITLERDRRATMSWAKSVDTHVSSDCDFYKRKVRTQTV